MDEARTKNEKRLSIPLPPGVKEVVEKRVKKSRRSQAMEVVVMLEEYIQSTESTPSQHN